jgi:NADPH:quinone reductase-like Zn-dependent oxidoreductase
MLPAAPELESSFGLECAGRIARVGEGVTEFAIGEPVVAYANGCFAAFVTTAAGAVTQRPAGLSASEAATMPAAFATAHYALVTQARLVKGERILIHAAAGGVGQAAVQIARHLGAEIFATAGSPEKRAALKAAGVAHVMDSRSLAFADEIKKITGGRGVDVVLNSLGGEFMSRSLELVAPHGRFLELGKRDLFKGGTLNLRPFAKIISFIVIDVGPDLPGFAALWSEVTARMHAALASRRDLPAFAPRPATVESRRALAATLSSHAHAILARAPAAGPDAILSGRLGALGRASQRIVAALEAVAQAGTTAAVPSLRSTT